MTLNQAIAIVGIWMGTGISCLGGNNIGSLVAFFAFIITLTILVKDLEE